MASAKQAANGEEDPQESHVHCNRLWRQRLVDRVTVTRVPRFLGSYAELTIILYVVYPSLSFPICKSRHFLLSSFGISWHLDVVGDPSRQ